MSLVRGDLKLLGDSGEVPIFRMEWLRFGSCYEIFSLLGKKNKPAR